ncbi:MAG TPA: dihydrodipicolinate synthase family protein [Gemmatimonadales bacterium]|nr:dihydrodipicolinate synthase family protein [Gemmatimonadales bacterium]
MKRLEGLLVPITTPFDAATGEVAPVLLRDNARAMLDAGVNGIVAGGSTGEAALLSEEEYRQILAWLRDLVPQDRWLIAGAGRESTRAAIAACRTAGDEGADAVLVRAPSYYGMTLSPGALTEHFRRIADASPVPVLLYNIPKYTKLTIPEATFAALEDHPNMLGAKDSSGDLKQFAAYREAAPKWTMLVGSGFRYYAALELGAAGGILAIADFAFPQALRLRDAFAHGDRTTAGAIQETLGPLHQQIVQALGPAGIKTAMDLVGLAGGPVRPPLGDLGPKDREQVAQALTAAGVGRVRAGPAAAAGALANR